MKVTTGMYDRLLNREWETKRQMMLFFRMTNRVVLKTGTDKYEKTQFLGYQLKRKKNPTKPQNLNNRTQNPSSSWNLLRTAFSFRKWRRVLKTCCLGFSSVSD